MRVLLQRVKSACVFIDAQPIASIEQGLLAYVGFGHDDDVACVQAMTDKLLTYRVFDNPNDPSKRDKLDLNLQQVNGGLLLVSQFTLLAQTHKGRRPNFTDAMAPASAAALFAHMLEYAKQHHALVSAGRFGADMQVDAVNDGPINLLLDS